MASLWRRTMVYLGLQDDDELDYSGEYETYGGDYAEPARDARDASEAPAPRDEYDETDNSRRSAERPPTRRDSTTVKATRDAPAEPDPLRRSAVREEPPPATPRPSVVRTIGPTTAARVHVLEPSGFGDAPEVGDRLKASQPVILNLQGLPKELQRRLIDFSSGLAYALGARMERVPVSDPVFLLTPTDVEVSQEEKERLQARGLYQA
jgi:cell division inhibitor SepF